MPGAVLHKATQFWIRTPKTEVCRVTFYILHFRSLATYGSFFLRLHRVNLAKGFASARSMKPGRIVGNRERGRARTMSPGAIQSFMQ